MTQGKRRSEERIVFFDEKLEIYKNKEVIVKIRNSEEARNSFHCGKITDYDKEYIHFGPGFRFLITSLMIIKTVDEMKEEREREKKKEEDPKKIFYFQGFHLARRKMMSFFVSGHDDLDAFFLVYEKFHADLPDELYLLQEKKADLVILVITDQNTKKDFTIKF